MELISYGVSPFLFICAVSIVYAEKARWLMLFVKHPATHWDGLCLSPAIVASKRKLVRHGDASLIDLRNYLFSRQCHVLLQLRRPAEICQRSTSFVHNCIKELRILEVAFYSTVSFYIYYY